MDTSAIGIRLSFLTQVDQAKYEALFIQAFTDKKTLTATAAKNVLSRSNFGDEVLAKIWDLSNVTNQPQLTFPEFALAMYLTSMKMTGCSIPSVLPDNIRNEIYISVQALQSPKNTQSQSITLSSLVPSPQPQRSTSTSILNSLAGGNSPIYMQQQLSTGISANSGTLPQVPMPTGMYGNNLAFANQMMPNSNFSSQSQSFQRLSNKVKIPWAVTAEEKKQYSKIFDAWDTDKVGYLTGEKAKEIFTQSGLAQNILMQIWNLSDPNNQGKLNVDEFAVAMHLIYRKLNGYDVPTSLPPELIPPSTRELKDTVDNLKDSILKNIAQKKSVTSFNSSSISLSIPSTQRSRSVSPGPLYKRNGKNEKSEYEDDDNVGYVSSARRMGPDRARWNSQDVLSSSTLTPVTSSYGYRGKATRILDLRKDITACKEKLKQMEEENKNITPKKYDELPYLEQKDINELKDKIRELQQEFTKSGGNGSKNKWEVYIDRTSELSNLADQEKSLISELRFMLDENLHVLIKHVEETEDDLKNKKTESLKQIHAKSLGEPASLLPDNIEGTGPNGEVTETDRIKAKAKALIAAKMGKITGKGANSTKINLDEELKKIEEERLEFKIYLDSIQDTIQVIEDNIKEIGMEMRLIGLDIRKYEQDQKIIDERNRFENGFKVAHDLKEFIDLLAFETAASQAPDVDPTFEARFPEFTL
ncbi:unnamed protein product [Cunninghamella blakesleeana]